MHIIVMLFCYDVKSITSQKQVQGCILAVHVRREIPRELPKVARANIPHAVSSHTPVPRPPPFYFCVHNNAVNANRKGGLGIIHHKLCISVQLHVSNCIITEV